MQHTNRNLKYLIVAVVAFMAIATLAGYPIPAEAIGGLGAVPFVTGEITLADINKKIDEQGSAWEQYKKANDELIKAKAEGKAVGDLEAKVAKIAEDLDKIEDAKAAMEETLLKIQRGAPGGDAKGAAELDLEVKQFNDIRRSFAPNGGQVKDLDSDAYVAYKSAFFKAIRVGDKMLSSDEVKALQAGVDSDGGYLLPAPTVGRVVAKVYELSPIRQIASTITISTEALEGLNDNDEASAGWVAETGARSETNTPQVGKWRIEAHEMYAAPKATQKLLDDSAVDVESWLAGKVSNKFARLEAAAYITGDGVAKPRGFTTYTLAETDDGSRAWGVMQKIKSGANADFAAATPADKLYDMVGAMKDAYLTRARWVTRREVLTKVRKFKDGNNMYLWQPSLQAGQPDTLLGYPITKAQDMPALAAGSVSLAFGDFAEGYQIVDRIGIRTLRDPFTNKPYVIFYSTKRTGGGVVNFEAIKVMTFEA